MFNQGIGILNYEICGFLHYRIVLYLEEVVMISKELLDILACPLCKTDVRLENDRIVCTKCGRRYPIKDEIPVMLIDEAELPEEPKKEN